MSAARIPMRLCLGTNGVLGWRKTPTTADVYSGIVAAITTAIADAGIDLADVDCVMIGTTQFTNAVIQRRSLLPVGIIRLGASRNLGHSATDRLAG